MDTRASASRGLVQKPSYNPEIELMSDSYEKWLNDVNAALKSINMRFDDWQSLWRFDFQREFNAGVEADEAAIKANRFWWQQQNRSLKQDCRKEPDCWLPRGHQDACQPDKRGDFVKVEFPGDAGMPSEWMWVRVSRCDEEKQLVIGTLDNEPLNDYDDKIKLGSELAVSFSPDSGAQEAD
jgi:hypothetical protein